MKLKNYEMAIKVDESVNLDETTQHLKENL